MSAQSISVLKVQRMKTLEEKDYPPEVNEILGKIVCTDKKFTDIDVDVAVVSVGTRAWNAKSHHFNHILQQGGDSQSEQNEICRSPTCTRGQRVVVEEPTLPFRAMYLVNLSLTKGEDEPSLTLCVQNALMMGVNDDKARVIGFEILGSLKRLM